MVERVSGSNAVQYLLNILRELRHAKPENPAGYILLSSMGLPTNATGLTRFYALLYEVDDLVRSKRGPSSSIVKVIEDLQDILTRKNLLTEKWVEFSSAIESKNIISVLELLSDEFNNNKTLIELDFEFIDEIISVLNDLESQIANSTLPNEIKLFCIDHIQDLTKVLRRYPYVDSKSVVKSAQSAIGDLYLNKELTEKIDKSDWKHSPILRFFGVFSALAAAVTPKDIPSAIGLAADMDSWARPKIEQVMQKIDHAERLLETSSGIEQGLKKVVEEINQLPKQLPPSKEQKALKPGSEIIDAGNAEIDNPSLPGQQALESLSPANHTQ